MYAAAGGASIASRRKQKRLQLSKQGVGVATPAINIVPSRLKTTAPGSRHHQHYQHHHQHHHHQYHQDHHHNHHYHHHHHHHHHHQQQSTKFSRQQSLVPPLSAQQHLQAQQAAPLTSTSSTSAFHTDRHRQADHHKSQQIAPVSPIQFPISPPPLSVESSASATYLNKSSNFPFPPPSILDLRVSTPTSELQCGGQGPGKAAWQGCNRPSPLPLTPTSPGYHDGYKTKQCEAHRRWMKRNRIRDASYCYGSSGEDDEEDGSSNAIRQRGEVSAAVNTILYAGLGTTALGLIISFVGTGEKGFLSPELRLVGPSLLCAGLLCCLFRVLLCLCLCHCGQCRWRLCPISSRKKEKAKKAESRPTGTLPTASLLPATQQQQQQQQHQQQQSQQQSQEQSAVSTSCNISLATRGHELLLSPAQLTE